MNIYAFFLDAMVFDHCRERSDTLSTDIFPDYPEYRLDDDLKKFVRALFG